MKSYLLQDAIGEIRDDFILDAHCMILENQNGIHGTNRQWFCTLRRVTAATAAVIVLSAAAVAGMASADIEPAYHFLYSFSPRIAQKLKPVKMSCEDNNIRFEVISAYAEEEELKIYISVQDLTGERIDATTDLFDSYSVNTPFDCSCNCQNISYDEESKTATFLISITQYDKQKAENSKITFQANKMLCNKQKFDSILSELDISSAAPEAAVIQPAQTYGGGGAYYNEYAKNCTVLIPQKTLCSPVDGVNITGLGFVDGKLHIQIQYDNVPETDNHGYIYFKNAGGETIHCAASLSFGIGNTPEERYEEYIYDLSPKELAQCEPYGYFVTCDTLIEGNWSITFPLETHS